MLTVLTQCTSECGSFSDVRFKQRAVIGFLTAEEAPPIEIQRRVQAVYGDQCDGVSTVRAVRKWFQKQNTNFFKDRFQKLMQRWRKCIEVMVIL